MALNGCSLGAFLSNIGYLRVCVFISTEDLFVPHVLLYCKAISMEWMNVNVKFIKTRVLCYLVGYTPHKYVERED